MITKRSISFKGRLDEIVNEVVRKEAMTVDEQALFPKRSIDALKKEQLFGLLVPEEYGGLGGTITDFTYVVERLARVCSSTAAVYFFHGQFVKRLLDFGDASQKHKYLSRLAGGYLGASSWSELKAGADKSNVNTTAYIAGDQIVINGSKAFCTGAGEAAVYSVLVKFDTQDGPRTAFVLIEKEDENVSFGDAWNGMGLRGSSTREIICDHVTLPKDRLLGSIGEGSEIMEQNKRNAIHPGIIGLGIARSALNEFIQELKDKPNLWDYQNTRMTLSAAEINVDALESLVYRASSEADLGLESSAVYAMKAKVFSAEVAVSVTDKVLHLMGARGYTKGQVIERLYRDAKAIGLMGPTTEIAKEYIAANMLRREHHGESI